MATIAAESRLSLFSLRYCICFRYDLITRIEKIARDDSIDERMKEMLINLIDSETMFLFTEIPIKF